MVRVDLRYLTHCVSEADLHIEITDAATWLTQQAHYNVAEVRADCIKLKHPEFA
jgi:hypothetical protein